MRLVVVRVLILVAFLVWRGTNSLWVLAVDRSRTAGFDTGLPGDGNRVRKGLLVASPGRPDDVAYDHLQLLWQHVPLDAKVYYVEDFAAARDLALIQRYFRIRWLVYPLYIQPISRPTLPESSDLPPLQGKPTYVLDVRLQHPEPPGEDFRRVDERGGAVLWVKTGKQ